MPPPFLRAILERIAYVCYLMLLVSSVGITWLGWIRGAESGDYTAMWVAMGGLFLTAWLHIHGHAHWHFRECQRSIDQLGATGSGERSEREELLADEITTLFERLEAEEDVWVRGGIRQQIAVKLAAAPAVRDDFAEALARHPEL